MAKVNLCESCTSVVREAMEREELRGRRMDVALTAVAGVALMGAALWMLLKPPADVSNPVVHT